MTLSLSLYYESLEYVPKDTGLDDDGDSLRPAFQEEPNRPKDSLVPITRESPRESLVTASTPESANPPKRNEEKVAMTKTPTPNGRKRRSSSNNERRGRLFVCGYDQHRLKSSLFPDYVGPNDNDQKPILEYKRTIPSKETYPMDVLLVGMHGPCDPRDEDDDDETVPSLNHVWLVKNKRRRNMFRGKILFVNGESHGDAVRGGQIAAPPDVYQIGYVRENTTQHSMWVPLCSIVLVGMIPPTLWSRVVDHDQKPQNTGEHFLLYVASHKVVHREQAFDQLSLLLENEKAHYANRICKGFTNSALPTPYLPLPDNWADNHQVYRHYRFCLVMENKNVAGYVTEKILLAFLGGCIPIYYGTTDVFHLFNRNAMVFYDVTNTDATQAALQRVRYLETNRTAYQYMLRNEPILANGDETVRDLFSLDDRLGNGHLKNRIRQMMGIDP